MDQKRIPHSSFYGILVMSINLGDDLFAIKNAQENLDMTLLEAKLFIEKLKVLSPALEKTMFNEMFSETTKYLPQIQEFIDSAKKESSAIENAHSSENLAFEKVFAVYRVFEEQFSPLYKKEKESNVSDTLLYPVIDFDEKSTARKNYKIGLDESIFFIRDTSSWNHCNQGVILTSDGIHFIEDNDNPQNVIFIQWENVENVKCVDSTLIFYCKNRKEYKIGLYNFVKSNDYSVQITFGNALPSIFKIMADAVNSVNNPFRIVNGKVQSLVKNGQYQEAIDYAKSQIDKDNINRNTLLCLISELYFKNQDYESVIDYSQEIDSSIEKESESYVRLSYYRYKSYTELNCLFEARTECFEVLKYANKGLFEESFSIYEEAKKDFSLLETNIRNGFLDMPYMKRKVVLIVKHYTDLQQSSIPVFEINSIPSINFPIGHPITNQLYVGHPFSPDVYVPFDGYQQFLLEDKIREFCFLVESLGADEISIENCDMLSNDDNSKKDTNVEGKAKINVVEVNGSMHSERELHLLDSLNHSISLHQTLNPQENPFVPDNLVWLKSEPSWQRLIAQRLSGNLLEHNEKIDLQKNQLLERNELEEIKGDLKTMQIEAHLNYQETDNNKKDCKINTAVNIKVKFAPIKK